jgi:hypothetical protein
VRPNRKCCTKCGRAGQIFRSAACSGLTRVFYAELAPADL